MDTDELCRTSHDWPLSLCAGGYERGPSGTTLEAMAMRYSEIPGQLVSAANGNLDNWDPALADAPTAAGP
jgi:hypothetical protein